MPYRPLFNEVDMKIQYTLTTEELCAAILDWLDNNQIETPENPVIRISKDSEGKGIAVVECRRECKC